MAKATRTIEIFRPGTHTTSAGAELTFTAADVRRIAESYDAAAAPAPVVIGHPTEDAPAFGWVSALRYDGDAERLRSDLGELAPEFTTMVADGKFKRVSAAFFGPKHPSNPKPGGYYLRHVGFLGAAAPAVTGLKPVHFAAAEGEILTVEFNAASGYVVARAFRALREYLIDKFGIEDADKAMPDYLVTSVEESNSTASPGYSATATPTPEELAMSATATETAAQLKAANDRVAELERQQREAGKANVAAFCAGLVEQKRILPADRPALEAALFAVDQAQAVEFTAEGATTPTKETPGAILRRLLSAKAAMITTTERTPAEVPAGGVARFTGPAGTTVDPKQAAHFAAVKKYQAEHSCDFATALAAVPETPTTATAAA